jgi:hypothetical protein
VSKGTRDCRWYAVRDEGVIIGFVKGPLYDGSGRIVVDLKGGGTRSLRARCHRSEPHGDVQDDEIYVLADHAFDAAELESFVGAVHA